MSTRTKSKSSNADLARAMAAIKADLGKLSNRVLAAEIGVTPETVRRARQSLRANEDDEPVALPDENKLQQSRALKWGVTMTHPPNDGLSVQRVVLSPQEFCVRNGISRQTYQRLRAQGRGPVEMRLGIGTIRITLTAELEWQRRMQEEGAKLEAQAVERAVKAGTAAAQSPTVSKRRRRPPHEKQNSPDG